MKKLLILLPAIIGLLWSCDPMEDTYNKLDDQKKPYSETGRTYTLLTADYTTASKAALVDALNASDTAWAKLIASQQAYNPRFTANDYVAPVLTKVFPALNKNSSVVVTYAYQDKPAYLTDLAKMDILEDTIYRIAWSASDYVPAFTPAKTAASKLPSILAAMYPTAPASGTFKLIEYNYSSTEAVSQSNDFKYFYQDFAYHTAAPSPYTPIGEFGWMNKDRQGTLKWMCRTSSGNNYAQFTSNASGTKNEAWLITKKIDLHYSTAPKLTFNVAAGYYNAPCLTVWISTDFDGNTSHIADATWVDITSNFTFPTGTGSVGAFASAGEADLSAYVDKRVYIAFKYTGDGRTDADRGADPLMTTTYRIDNVKVSETKTSWYIPSSERQMAVYKYNGTAWVVPTATDPVFQILLAADYTTMGLTAVTSTQALTYLPQFLAQKYPYAQAGDVKTLVYKTGSNYYSTGVSNFTLTSGVWVTNTFKVNKTDQFVHTGEKWIFDPTVRFTPAAADFQLLVDWVYANKGRSYGSSYGNDEFYYGASAYQKNFDLRVSTRTQYNVPGYAELATTEEKIARTWSMLEEGLIQLLVLKYPAAQTDVAGIPIYYWVTFGTYENDLAKNTYVGIFKCSTPGTPPVFVRDKAFEDAQVSAGTLTAAQVGWNR